MSTPEPIYVSTVMALASAAAGSPASPPQVLAQASRAGRIAGARCFLRRHQLRFAMNVSAGRVVIELALGCNRHLSSGQMHGRHAVPGEKSCGRARLRIAVTHHHRCQQRRYHHSCPNPASHECSPGKQEKTFYSALRRDRYSGSRFHPVSMEAKLDQP